MTDYQQELKDLTVTHSLRLIKDREWLLANATWHGSYLYAQ